MALSDWQGRYFFANTNRGWARRRHLVPFEPYEGALCGATINPDSLRDTFPTDGTVCPDCEKLARARA